MSFKICAGRSDCLTLTYEVLFILEKTVCHRKIRGTLWLVKQWAFNYSSVLSVANQHTPSSSLLGLKSK